MTPALSRSQPVPAVDESMLDALTDLRHEVLDIEGLSDDAEWARRFGNGVGALSDGCDHDDSLKLFRRALADVQEDVLPADLGHQEIEKNEIVISRGEMADGVTAVFADLGITPHAKQDRTKERAGPFVVVDDQGVPPDRDRRLGVRHDRQGTFHPLYRPGCARGQPAFAEPPHGMPISVSAFPKKIESRAERFSHGMVHVHGHDDETRLGFSESPPERARLLHLHV